MVSVWRSVWVCDSNAFKARHAVKRLASDPCSTQRSPSILRLPAQATQRQVESQGSDLFFDIAKIDLYSEFEF